MWTWTTPPEHEPGAHPRSSTSVSSWMRVTRHSKATGLSATRGGRTSAEASGVRPARANSSTSGPTDAEVSFIGSARARVARFQTNSPVDSALVTLSLWPVLENPTMGGR